MLLGKFDEFSNSTSLDANRNKCSIYFGGISINEEQHILELTGFNKGLLPFKYLGVPLHSRRLSIDNCQPLINRITAQIKHWTSRLLSYAGRLQLINSVISGIAAYWLQVFPVPKAVIKHIQAICRSFLWIGTDATYKKAPVSWKTVCQPKNVGGLKIMNLNVWNAAMISKLVWNISTKKDTLWVKWIHVYYLKNRIIHQLPFSSSWSWMFKAIVGCSLKCLELHEWPDVLAREKFPTSRVYKILQGHHLSVPWRKIFYTNHARPRATFILWLTCHCKLPTKDRLNRFGILNDGLCCFCGGYESINHLFYSCVYTNTIWRKVLTWLRIQHVPGCWTDEIDWLRKTAGSKHPKAKTLKMAAAESVYAIWIVRNKMIFRGEAPRDNLAYDICKNVAISCEKNRILSAYVQKLDGRIVA